MRVVARFVSAVASWVRRNPVQVTSVAAIVAGVADAVQAGDVTTATVVAWVFALVAGGPAALRSRLGTTSEGGWVK